MSRLQGKNALITGASSGIGKATAIRFAQEGANVAINYYNDIAEAEAALAEVKKADSTGKHMIVQADVSRESQVQSMFAKVLDTFGSLDVLVNNAGIQMETPSHELTEKDFDLVLSVNLKGPFLCAKEAIRHFLSREAAGVILNTSSVHQVIPKPLYLSYSISKGALSSLTRTLALEYAGRRIRVNNVAPGAVITPINRAWIDDPKARAVVESHIPMGRAADPAEMAAVFAFLASDDASYVTGETIFAGGGIDLFAEFRTNWSS